MSCNISEVLLSQINKHFYRLTKEERQSDLWFLCNFVRRRECIKDIKWLQDLICLWGDSDTILIFTNLHAVQINFEKLATLLRGNNYKYINRAYWLKNLWRKRINRYVAFLDDELRLQKMSLFEASDDEILSAKLALTQPLL